MQMADLDFTSSAQNTSTFNPTPSNESIDPTLDPDIDMAIEPAPNHENTIVEPPPEPRVPTRKDVSLREFLSKMDDYAPIVRAPPTRPASLYHSLPKR